MKPFLLLILLVPVFLAAQQYQLEELINQGLQHSFNVQKSELGLATANSTLGSAKLNLLPDFDLSAGISNDFDPLPGAEEVSSYAGFSVSKTLSLNDADYFNYRYASLDKTKAALQFDQTRRSYAYQVFSAYLEVLGATRQLNSLQENQQIQNRVWEQSKVMLQLGKTTPFDVKQNEIAVLNSNIAIMQLNNTISNARSKLFALVQMQDEGYPLADLDLNLEAELPACNPEASSDIVLLNQELKRNDLELKQDRLNNYPRMNLAYSLDRKVSGADFDFDRYTTNHSISLSLSYPLLNYFKNGQNSTRTKIARQLSQLAIDEKSDQINRDYASAVQELNYLKRMDELYSEKLAQSREQIKQAEERYRLGLIELLELDKTRTDYIETDIAYNNNRYQIIAKQEAITYLLSLPVLGKW
jgi:outer membrane protein